MFGSPKTDPDRVTLLDALVESIERARAYNANDAVAPAVVLWPDGERQWESLLPDLRLRLPILTLGDFQPESRTGPAYWLRCMIARTLPDDPIPGDATPVIYLPGVTRADLRAVESCPEALQPLAELQYRGVFWSHKNGKDWTVSAFLQSPDGGLGLNLEASKGTRETLMLALTKLDRLPLSSLRAESIIDEDFLREIINPDAKTQVLRWLDDQTACRAAMTPNEWTAFRQYCVKHLDFDPEKDGPLTAARKLGERKKSWLFVWKRYFDSAEAYPGVARLLKQVSPAHAPSLMEEQEPWPGKEDSRSSWPGLNEGLEESLRASLASVGQMSAADAGVAIIQLDRIHGPRRDWLWARLGQSPLTGALDPLVRVTELSKRTLLGSTVAELSASYAQHGWEVDAAAIDTLLAIRGANQSAVAAVHLALDAIYRPWLSDLATRFQQLISAKGYQAPAPPKIDPGTCLLFCDGLRFDLGQRLQTGAISAGMAAGTDWRLAAVPTVTPSAKPALLPIATQLLGGNEFSVRTETSSTNLTHASAGKVLQAAGVQFLSTHELGDPAGRAWTEIGAIDQYGHGHGWKVAAHAIDEIRDILDRAKSLLEAGWQKVVIVTDHGWLLLPRPLPKSDLAVNLAEPRKGRCARLKPGADAGSLITLPWTWDTSVRVAYAPGISIFEGTETYEHGGLSLQECVTPVITVTSGAPAPIPVAITRLRWVGLKCSLTVTGAPTGASADLRVNAADSSMSKAKSAKELDPDGTAALFVEDYELEGKELEVVIRSVDGVLLTQRTTIVGGE